ITGSGLAPYLVCKLDNETQLFFLSLRRNWVSRLHAGKAALRANRQAIEVDKLGSLVDARPQFIFAFHVCRFGRDEAEHNFLARRNEAQWRERAWARRIVFKEIESDVECIEQALGDRVVAALRVPLPAAIASTKVHADGQVRGRILEHAVCDRNVSID